MDVVSWALNTIDTVFSTRKSGPGEPNCPAGTATAGYGKDTYNWKLMCDLSIEDVEDIYLFGIMISGLLLIGFGVVLMYRKLKKMDRANQNADPAKLFHQFDQLGRTLIAANGELNRKIGNISMSLGALQEMFLKPGNVYGNYEAQNRMRDENSYPV